MSTNTADAVIALLKQAKSPGDVARALAKDPMLLFGLVVILALIYLFARIYIWPQINPFKVQWISNLWDWATSPRPPTPEETHPYAKVIYPIYR
jgi:hypothetical protein